MSLHDLALVYIQVVREKLVALEIPFVQHTTVRGSPKRQLLVDKYGKFAVPYLEVSMMICISIRLLRTVIAALCTSNWLAIMVSLLVQVHCTSLVCVPPQLYCMMHIVLF